MDSFSNSDRQGFDIWISNRLDEKCSWEDIENLCCEEGDFQSALDDLIEAEMWPEDITQAQWKLYVEYYKKLHPSVVLSQTQKVVGIDNNGLNNTALFNGSSWLVKLLNGLFPIKISLEPGLKSLLMAMLLSLTWRILYR